MKTLYLTIFLTALLFSAYGQKKKINIASELGKLSDIQSLPQYWGNTVVKQVSSYDTTGNNNDGFSGKYSFIRKTPDGSLVIFEEEGNGVINRIWTPTPTTDTLDFYFSGSHKPSFSIRFLDLFTGNVFPFVAPLSGNEVGGYYSYFPIPYKNGCKIVLRGDKLEFYQIQHRAYPKGYSIENFSLEPDESTELQLKALVQSWENIDDLKSNITIHTDTVLKAGHSITVAEVSEGGRILGINISPAKSFTGLRKQIDLKVSWDDKERPAIYMPVADFFGYAFGHISMQSLLLGTKNDINYCYFPMPFDTGAKVELLYRDPGSGMGAEDVRIKADIFMSDKKRIPTLEGKFYAHWNRAPETTPGKPHVLLEGKGKGHYVGTILQAQGLNAGMTSFFEGDDVTYADGEMTVHGTGSEDYFNGGWYALMDRWDRKISLPMHGSLVYSLPFARTGGYRLFISDKMPFEKHIDHTIEHGPEQNNVSGDYTSVALYYADQPIGQSEAPTNSNTGIFIPDTFMYYPQLLPLNLAGKVTVEGNMIQSTTGGKVRIDLGDLPRGRYKLYADIEKTSEGAEITVWQRQGPLSKPVSFFAKEKVSKPNVYLCDINISDFKKTITLNFKRDEDKSKIYVNRWILVRQP